VIVVAVFALGAFVVIAGRREETRHPVLGGEDGRARRIAELGNSGGDPGPQPLVERCVIELADQLR
jgi:hypothetical protein